MLLWGALLALPSACIDAGPRGPTRAFQVPEAADMRWFKGNTHTHTTESDGDSPP